MGMAALALLVPGLDISKLLFHRQDDLLVFAVTAYIYAETAYAIVFPIRRKLLQL